MSETLRVAIVDDEEPARLLVRELLASCPDVEVIAECTNGFEAVKVATELHPDLLLLDIQMPKLDGFEVIELLGGSQHVIFITAYDTYAIRAFEANAIDYLLKPFTTERLRSAIDRARDHILRHEPLPVDKLLGSARPAQAFLQRILVRDGAAVTIIPADSLDYADAQDDYVGLHFGGRTVLKQQTLSDLASALDPARFVRIHRSYVLNIERLRKLELYAKDSREAILADGTRLPVSRSGYQRLQELL
ncbi:MAG: response regulator [Acidobacteriota bacterium]